MSKRNSPPGIINGDTFAYALDRNVARTTGRWPDVPKHARARSFGALKAPTNELVAERNAWVEAFPSVSFVESGFSRKLRRP